METLGIWCRMIGSLNWGMGNSRNKVHSCQDLEEVSKRLPGCKAYVAQLAAGRFTTVLWAAIQDQDKQALNKLRTHLPYREQHRDEELVIIPRELAAMSREGVAGRPVVNNTSFQRFEDASPDGISASWVHFQAYLPASRHSGTHLFLC